MSAVSKVVMPASTCAAISSANLAGSMSPCPPASCQHPAVIRETDKLSPMVIFGILGDDAIVLLSLQLSSVSACVSGDANMGCTGVNKSSSSVDSTMLLFMKKQLLLFN